METVYIVYSTRAQGWVYRNGTYGTGRTEAKRFTYDEAKAYIAERLSPEGGATHFPVDLALLNSAEGAA